SAAAYSNAVWVGRGPNPNLRARPATDAYTPSGVVVPRGPRRHARHARTRSARSIRTATMIRPVPPGPDVEPPVTTGPGRRLRSGAWPSPAPDGPADARGVAVASGMTDPSGWGAAWDFPVGSNI